MRPFQSERGGKFTISHGGGWQPQWRADGRELYYVSSEGDIGVNPVMSVMAVPVSTETTDFEAGVPKVLFKTPIGASSLVDTGRNLYAATNDGQRFLVATPGESEDSPITVRVNWMAGATQ